MSKGEDAAKQDMDALAASTKVLTEASHSQMETLAQTAESEMQLLSNTAAQLSEENHKQLMELTKASSEQMSVISEAANNVMQNSKQQIEEAIKATQAQSDRQMHCLQKLWTITFCFWSFQFHLIITLKQFQFKVQTDRHRLNLRSTDSFYVFKKFSLILGKIW